MKTQFQVKNSAWGSETAEKVIKFLEKNEGKICSLELKTENQRTIKQNSALHKWFTIIADELNSVGCPLSVQIGNRTPVEHPWTMQAVKDNLWRPVQLAITKKKSTTQLERKEIDQIFEPINKWLSETWLISIPFPSEEELRIQSLIQ